MPVAVHDAAGPPNAARLVSAFLNRVQEPRSPFISPARFVDAAGLSLATLATLSGVHRNTIRRNPGSERLQRKLRDMIKVITSACELTGDVDRAIYWFRNEPIADHRHRTAAEMVAAGHAGAVLVYLEDLKTGAAG
jgi:hypothetical protein